MYHLLAWNLHTAVLNADPNSCPPEVRPRPMKTIYTIASVADTFVRGRNLETKLRQELMWFPGWSRVKNERTNKQTNKWTNEQTNEWMSKWVNHSWCSVYGRHQQFIYCLFFLYSTRSFELWPCHGCLRYVVGILSSELYFPMICKNMSFGNLTMLAWMPCDRVTWMQSAG